MSATGGRSALGPLLLFLPLCALALALVQLLGRRPAADSLGRELREGERVALSSDGAVSRGFSGSAVDGASVLEVRLSPFHAEPDAQRAYADALGRRLELPAGEPWRLELTLVATDARISLGVPRVSDARGTALEVLGGRGPAGPPDPVRVLFSDVRGAAGVAGQTLLWGRPPGEDAVLRLEGARAFQRIPLEPGELAPDVLPRSFVELGGSASAVLSAEHELALVRKELEQVRRDRRERELQWYEFNRALAKLDLVALAEGFAVDPAFEPEEDEEAALESPADESAQSAVDPFAGRMAELALSLRALLDLSGLESYDLVELGTLGRGWVGPVVFRILDERGRLSGSLFAERLRLEGSRSGRTVTLVLEDGYESHRGERTPFRDGTRRVVLPFVDPNPWIASIGELFPASLLQDVLDDGLWDREALRRELNRLLALDIGSGWYRLQGFGGVLGDELTDVHLELLDTQGRLQRRFFADRMSLAPEPPGIVIALEDGVILRGEETTAFRGGEHRIFLPRVEMDLWRAAAVPGVSGWPD